MVVYRRGLVLSPTRRGRNKGRCDICSAGVPPAMVVYRCGLVLSLMRRGRCKGRCDSCSAGVPPAMVCADAGWFSRPRIRIRPLSRSLPLFRTMPSSSAFWAAVTLWRPGDPASHHRRGRSWVDWKGCDPADGAPAACLVAGTADRIALPVGAPLDVFPVALNASGWWKRKTSRTARPVKARSACPASASVADPAAAPDAAPDAAPVADRETLLTFRRIALRRHQCNEPASSAR